MRTSARAARSQLSTSISVDTCLSDPDVEAAWRALCNAEAGPGCARARGAGPSFAKRFSQDVVGVAAEEAEWLEDYLCTVQRLREGMVADLDALLESEAPAEEVDAVLSTAKSERAAVLEDLEGELGKDRYARLRSVGGLGILGAALDCTDLHPP